jgi:hypothetical protein
MKPFTQTRIATLVVAVALATVQLLPTGTLAAEEDPPLAPPSPTAAPSRQPTYRTQAPAGALRLTGTPPKVGATFLDDSLANPGVIPASLRCPTGKNVGEFVGEGYILKVTGRCMDGRSIAYAGMPPLPDLQVPDGEIQLEAKVVSGHERALIVVLFRLKSDPNRAYALLVHPGLGEAQVQKEEAGRAVPLARRFDLAGRLSREDWNRLAVRLDGQSIWVLLNDEPILSASDAGIDSGAVSFGLERIGSLDDNAESAAVFRNLRISGLAPEP